MLPSGWALYMVLIITWNIMYMYVYMWNHKLDFVYYLAKYLKKLKLVWFDLFQVKFDCCKVPHFKILTMRGYGTLGIRGIQCTLRGSYRPILVGCLQFDYTPDPLPDDVKNHALWIQLQQAMKEWLNDLQSSADHNHWACVSLAANCKLPYLFTPLQLPSWQLTSQLTTPGHNGLQKDVYNVFYCFSW